MEVLVEKWSIHFRHSRHSWRSYSGFTGRLYGCSRFDSMDGIGTPPWTEKVENVGTNIWIYSGENVWNKFSNTFSRVESGTEAEITSGICNLAKTGRYFFQSPPTLLFTR